ncbi:MAG: hypothetical protein H6Q89_1590 [Myxococcaceae bacterium]|nr:hypothetical protein [Myxococcaceae bacterium]
MPCSGSRRGLLEVIAAALVATSLVGCLEAHQCTLVDGGRAIVDTGTQCYFPRLDAGPTDAGSCDAGTIDGGC